MRIVSAVLQTLLAILYPFAIWWSLMHWSARAVGVIGVAVLVPLMLLRHWNADRSHLMAALRVPLLVIALMLLGAVLDDARFVLAMPVLLSAVLLVTFGATLFGGGPTLVERFARMKESALSPAQVAHCRQVTIVWCGFFVVNAVIAGTLAWLELRRAWAIYTGGVAYALMGALFAGEYVVRQIRFRHYGTGLHDRMLARLFPPRSESAPPEEAR